MTVNLGIGLTNDCNLRCPHCYRPDPPARYLAPDDVERACAALDIEGVSLGTGESGLHPQFREILGRLLARGLRVSLTSNGLTVASLPDDVLARLHDVEISLDFPDRDRFDRFRGDGAWEWAIGALERCARLGLRRTVLAVLMNVNFRELRPLARVAAAFGAPLRVNVYQPVRGLRFAPTWHQFWYAVVRLLGETTLLACTEPVVAAAAGLPTGGLRCGRTSLRITPAGELLPCVYWPWPAGSVADVAREGERIFERAEIRHPRLLPPECAECDLVEACGGGCAGRRALRGGLLRRDPYCPRAGRLARPIAAHPGGEADRLHVGNVCTLLVQSRA